MSAKKFKRKRVLPHERLLEVLMRRCLCSQCENGEFIHTCHVLLKRIHCLNTYSSFGRKTVRTAETFGTALKARIYCERGLAPKSANFCYSEIATVRSVATQRFVTSSSYTGDL